jgi:carbon storage regulator
MLVISREKSQSVVIGDTIVVKIIGIENRKVVIGIEAPKSVPVQRLESSKILRCKTDKEVKEVK